MARGAFSNEEVKKSLQLFVPVIVDGDVEKKVMDKFGVRGFPTVKFVTADEQEHGTLRDRSPRGVMAIADQTLKTVGPIKLTKAFRNLMKSDAKLDKAIAKKKNKDAIKAINEIEEIGHKGVVFDKAMKEKKRITEVAEKQLAEAKGLMDESPGRAKTKLKKIARDFKGLEIADEANKLLKSLDA